MNTNCPTLKLQNQLQDKNPVLTRKGRDPQRRKPGGKEGWSRLLLYGGLISHENPTQDAKLTRDSCMEGFRTLTQREPPKLNQQPENKRPFGHFDGWQAPGVCLSVQSPFLILQWMLTGQDILVSFLFLLHNLPFPPSWMASLNLGCTIKCAEHFSPSH